MSKALIFSVFVFFWSFSDFVFARPFNLDFEHVPSQLIVKFAGDSKTAANHSVLRKLGGEILVVFRTNGAILVNFPQAKSENELDVIAAKLSKIDTVDYIEANTLAYFDTKIPNDPRFKELYALHNTGQHDEDHPDVDIGAAEAWDITTGSRNVLIAVIDSGIDYSHPDIAPNYWNNPGETGLDAQGRDKRSNEVDDDHNGFIDDWRGWNFAAGNNNPMDSNGHGTHCAGTIGAKGNNNIGVVGVNWDVSLVALRIASDKEKAIPVSKTISAIEYATSIGAVATNNSYGSRAFSRTEFAAIEAAGKKGILLVASAGNNLEDDDELPHYPASYQLNNVISVAAVDPDDSLADYSSWGIKTVHVAAPGSFIISTTPKNTYSDFSGTSMSTPHVTGSVALIKSVFPNLSGFEIRSRLFNTVTKTPALEGKIMTGGRINVYRALSQKLTIDD